MPREFSKICVLGLAILTLTACSKPEEKPKADPKAAENDAMKNMEFLGKNGIVYAADNSDKFPNHLAELVALQFVKPENLLDPRLGHTAMAATTEKDWLKIKDDVDAHCDFYYAGAGVTTAMEDVIILYDKGVPGGTRMVFFAGIRSATFAPGSPELKAAVAKSNAVPGAGRAKLPENLDGPPMIK